MWIYPVAGRLRRDPRSGQPVPPQGRDVPETDAYWIRALRNGDVTTDAPEKAEPRRDSVAEAPAHDEEHAE